MRELQAHGDYRSSSTVTSTPRDEPSICRATTAAPKRLCERAMAQRRHISAPSSRWRGLREILARAYYRREDGPLALISGQLIIRRNAIAPTSSNARIAVFVKRKSAHARLSQASVTAGLLRSLSVHRRRFVHARFKCARAAPRQLASPRLLSAFSDGDIMSRDRARRPPRCLRPSRAQSGAGDSADDGALGDYAHVAPRRSAHYASMTCRHTLFGDGRRDRPCLPHSTASRGRAARLADTRAGRQGRHRRTHDIRRRFTRIFYRA